MARGGYAGMYAADIQSCSDNWGGTSGAAPLAAGVVALWLEAVPALTWLDVQGVMVYSSSRARTAASHATSWAYNGAGVPFSHWFGFGVIDAMKGLTVARQWVSYSDLQETTSGVVASTATFSSTQLLSVSWSCQAPNTRRVKSVDVAVVARHGRRGDLRVSLVSPHGTRCQLARPRPLDSSSLGLNNRFVCNAFWDEKPTGIWRLEIADTKANPAGALQSYRITVFHTAANVFSDVTTRPVSPDRPPNAITVFQPTVIVSAPGAFQTPAPSGAAVPYTLVDASSGGWRFRVGPLHANEVAQWRFADVEYGEMSGPTGSVWQSGAAPFGYAEASLRESFTFATPLANTTTSAIFRKEFFLSAAQIALISRFVLYSASDDYATVFVNGLPLLGEAPPALARNMAYWNEQKEFGRSVVRTGVNMIAVQVFNRNGSRDMGMDLRLDAVLLPGAAGSFPAPMPIPTPAPSPGTRISVIAVTDPLGSAVTDRSGAPVTSVITLPDFTDFFSADDTTEPAPLPTPENAALPYALGSSVPYLLFVLIGIAFCCVCVVILLAVVYLVRSRRGRQRRVLQRGRSRTRVTDYDGEVEREMGRKSDTTATKTPPALERKPTVADLPAAPHKDRPLPGVQPVGPQRATPDAEPKKLEQFASARDSPQVRRKTTVLPPLTAGATAPPAAEEPAPVDRPAARTPAGGSPVGTPQPARRAAAATAAVPAAAMGTPPASRRAVTGAPAPKLGYVDLDASGVLHDSLPEDISLDALDVPPPPFDETLQFERGGSQLKQSVAAESGDEDDDDDGSWNEQLPPVPADFT
jgi:subtilisin-like proprotein convertase family protein